MLRMLCFECYGYRQGQMQHDRPRVKFHLARSGREVWPVGWRDGGVPWSFTPRDLQQSVWCRVAADGVGEVALEKKELEFIYEQGFSGNAVAPAVVCDDDPFGLFGPSVAVHYRVPGVARTVVRPGRAIAEDALGPFQ